MLTNKFVSMGAKAGPVIGLAATSMFLLLLAFGRPFAQPREPEAVPGYDAQGRLLRPAAFASWVFVGSNLGLGYADDVTSMTRAEKSRTEQQDYHNIYIDPVAYAGYLATGTFPEGTILVMDVYEAATKETLDIGAKGSVLNAGTFNGQRRKIEVAVKDSKRPNRRDVAGNDRSVGAWAYYDFGAKGATARAFADADCFNCHRDHAGDDNVWVQFYPTLRRIKHPE